MKSLRQMGLSRMPEALWYVPFDRGVVEGVGQWFLNYLRKGLFSLFLLFIFIAFELESDRKVEK